MDENTRIVILAFISAFVTVATAIISYLVGKKRGNSK